MYFLLVHDRLTPDNGLYQSMPLPVDHIAKDNGELGGEERLPRTEMRSMSVAFTGFMF